MPKRTNEFQQLVALIQNALAPQGAKITESAMVEIDGLRTMREVDILVEGKFGCFQMKVAVEVKDEGRKFSLQDFDSLLAKYRGECRVVVDKFAIVTRRGFTEGVLEKARKVGGVELLTLDEAREKDWSQEKPGIFHFRHAPHICQVWIDPPINGISNKRLMRDGELICTCCGKAHGSLLQYAQKTVFQEIFPSRPDLVSQLDDEVQKRPGGQAMMTLSTEVTNRAIRIDGCQHKIERLAIGVHAVSARASMTACKYELTSLEGRSQSVTFMEGAAGGKRFRFVLPDGLNSKKVVMRIDSLGMKQQPKVGRNSTCACGSGKKYKKCCGKRTSNQ